MLYLQYISLMFMSIINTTAYNYFLNYIFYKMCSCCFKDNLPIANILTMLSNPNLSDIKNIITLKYVIILQIQLKFFADLIFLFVSLFFIFLILVFHFMEWKGRPEKSLDTRKEVRSPYSLTS